MVNALKFKSPYLFFTVFLFFVLHIPIVFGKAKFDTASPKDPTGEPLALNHLLFKAGKEVTTPVKTLYDSLRLSSLGLARQAYDYALKGLNVLQKEGQIGNSNIISIADFSRPSSEKRLFVIDIKNAKLLFQTYVAHGVNSGKEFAKNFSNAPESNESSPGFYQTLGTYIGGNGYSLRLRGIESGINDNAVMRDIVMHGADYVNEKLARSRGYIGRSWGCPAIPQKLHRPIIDRIKNGTCLFLYSPDRSYLDHSKIIQAA